MIILHRTLLSAVAIGTYSIGGAVALAAAAAPTARQALELKPVQKDVEYDRPADEDAAKCTIKPEKAAGQTGWVVRTAAGDVLRNFVDTNGDNIVDQWRYYKDGIEVYRDIDANFNNKADQSRWLGSAGTRWGIDVNEDGRIDGWKAISPEEVTAEVVAALRERDPARFARLLLSPKELKSLGLGSEKAAALTKKLEAAPAAIRQLVDSQQLVGEATKWVYFGGSRPGVVPSGTAGSTSDITVYENVTAMIETDSKGSQIPVGTLVKVGDAWRLIDVPDLSADLTAATEPHGFFYPTTPRKEAGSTGTAGGPNKAVQDLLGRLEALDKEAAAAATQQDHARLIDERVETLQKLADLAESPEARAQWLKQLIDTVSAAAQGGNYPDGIALLDRVRKGLKAETADAELAAHLDYSKMTIRYYQDLQKDGVDYAKVQGEWLEQLKTFIKRNPTAADSADALLQLGIAEEFAGNDAGAIGWYKQIADNHAGTSAGRKAVGAVVRLESAGKKINLQGKSLEGETVDLNKLKDRVVIVHFWSTTAGPSTADLPLLKDLLERFGKRENGLSIVGVNLDVRSADLQQFLAGNPLKWPQIFEDGGMDSRLANELGIHQLPTMLLIDRQGRVANRGIHAPELEKEVKSLLR